MRYKLSDDTWDKKEREAIERVIKSNRFTMGKEVEKFEEEFAKKIGVKYAIMSNSGSSANLLTIASLIYSGRLKRGDEVIVPAVSWSTTYFPLSQYGLKLKFIDIDSESLNISINKLKSAISKDTKAIMSVNLLGNSNDYKIIKRICTDQDLILIEDNCEALGAKFEGEYLGTIGGLGTFSTFYSHHLCTMEGGMTVTDDIELYHYMLAIRAHGWTRNLPKENQLDYKNKNSFYESFNFIVPGYNLRPLEMEAAIGREQLGKWDKIIEQRRANAESFKNIFNSLDGIRLQTEIGESSWLGFSITLEKPYIGLRDELVSFLKKANIEVRPIVAGNFTRNEAIKYLDYEIYDNLDNADDIHENGFFVGNHSKNNIKEIKYLRLKIKEFLEN